MYGVKNVLPQTAALNRTELPFALAAEESLSFDILLLKTRGNMTF
jgi:hypothetical protein